MDWQVATLIKRERVSEDVYSLIFKLDTWKKHIPGQHYDIRLTSEDGYQAQRSYSIASAPEEERVIEFGIQLLDDGEVSPYLVNQLQISGQIEVKGPLGGHFIWDINIEEPLLLIAGGSGVVPFISMLRHYHKNIEKVPIRPVILLFSAYDLEHAPYYHEIKNFPEIKTVLALTKQAPPNWPGYQRRIDKDILRDVFGSYLDQMPMVFICGSNPFVESVANNMVDLGFQDHFIKTERFGG